MIERVVIVTGGASGIGEAIAHAFADRGDAVCVADTDPAGEIVARSIRNRGATALFIQADVSSGADVDGMVRRTLDEWGRLDFACNCAGVLHDRTPTADVTLESWNHVMRVNLDGVFHCLRAEIPAIITSGGGVVVNVASVAGLYGRAGAGLAAYAASKAGVIQLTKVAARDYAKHGIRVVALAPGAVDTPMLRRSRTKDVGTWMDESGEMPPGRRIGHASDVASAALWLCSPAASYVSGTTIRIDGGKYG